MKYLKALGLAVIAAGALMAIAGTGSASATELTCTEPAGVKVMCPVGTLLHAESEGHVIFDSPIGKVECHMTIAAATANTGSSSETVRANITAFTITGCTNGAVNTVLAKGELEIHTTETNANNDGTLTSTGTEWTQELLGAHCIFRTNQTDIGWLTGSTTVAKAQGVETATPTLDISASIPRVGGRSGALCGSTAPLTGSLKFDKPDWMDID